MNLLGLIFSLLIVFALISSSVLSSAAKARAVDAAYFGAARAQRTLFSLLQKELYTQAEGKSTRAKPKEREPQDPLSLEEPLEEAERIKERPACARISLFPLLAGGKEAHPNLYRICLKMAALHYQEELFQGKRIEPFFQRLLQRMQESLLADPSFSLEKLSFLDPEDRRFYYLLLKGTKEFSFAQPGPGYPSFLDLFTLKPREEPLCLLHADPLFLHFWFGPLLGEKLYGKLHNPQEEKPSLSFALIEQLYRESRLVAPSPETFSLIDLTGKRHTSLTGEEKIVAEDEETKIKIVIH